MIETTRVDSTLVLRMAHGKANAMDVELMRSFREAIERGLRSDAEALVITGSGTIFSAGVDLFRASSGGRAYLAEFLPELSAGFKALFAAEKPVVAAVNGHAIAGGCIVACACDYRVMAAGSGRIGVPELRVGVPFPMVPAEILRYALGNQRAQRAMLVGNVVEAEEAVAQGFVDELVSPGHLVGRAIEIATAIAQTPPASYARTKRDLRRPVFETWDRLQAAHDVETLEAWASSAVQSAIAAYLERTLKKTPGQA